jgi:hypothetical protein
LDHGTHILQPAILVWDSVEHSGSAAISIVSTPKTSTITPVDSTQSCPRNLVAPMSSGRRSIPPSTVRAMTSVGRPTTTGFRRRQDEPGRPDFQNLDSAHWLGRKGGPMLAGEQPGVDLNGAQVPITEPWAGLGPGQMCNHVVVIAFPFPRCTHSVSRELSFHHRKGDSLGGS